MILDTSAVIAIIFKEPEWEAMLTVMAQATALSAGTATLVECGIVLGARQGFEQPHLQRFLQTFDVTPITFGEHHWVEAIGAYHRYGRGRHPAALNFGDCLSYATAKLAKEPLLCKGEDFIHTDLPLVSY